MRRNCLRIFRGINNKKGNMNNEDYWSSFEDELTTWKDVYNLSNQEDYEMCSDYASENIHSRKYDLDSFDFLHSFVSIDFENLFPQRVSACSVGMVKYINGEITDKYYTLIRPPFEYEGKRGPALTWIHGFTEEMFEGERTFAEILPEMEAFIEGLPLVAHNACVERACIHDACTYYNIETTIPYDDIIDTYILSKLIEERLGVSLSGSGSHSLNIVCQRFGVKELRHHHACDDAEMCGNLFLIFPKYMSGELAFDKNISCMDSGYHSKSEPIGNNIYESYALKGHTNLCGDVLQKDLSGADPNNPFYNRKVVITGVFKVERQELAKTLKSMGADIDTSVSSKTKYLLIGEEPGPSKLKKFDQLISEGKDVRKIYQDDLDKILAGEGFEHYHTEIPITASKTKTLSAQDRKTPWPQLVEKFKRYVCCGDVEFTERETQSKDYYLLNLYYQQQQKIPTTKVTVLENLRQLDEESECKFRKDILSCFKEGEIITKENACDRMQKVFTKFGLQFKAKTSVLTEFGVKFEVHKLNKILHLTIINIPQS